MNRITKETVILNEIEHKFSWSKMLKVKGVLKLRNDCGPDLVYIETQRSC